VSTKVFEAKEIESGEFSVIRGFACAAYFSSKKHWLEGTWRFNYNSFGSFSFLPDGSV